jgi:hypothetical protein
MAAFGPSGRWEATDADAEVEAEAAAEAAVFTGSGLMLLGALGCDFHNHPPVLDSTETEKAIAVESAIPAINSAANLFVLVDLENLR